jgi:predicted lipoprotein with Yx(FWY)xxD motif
MRTRRTLTRFSAGAIFAALALCVACVSVVPAASGATSTGSAVGVLDGPYGPMLVAGSGPSAGTALYMITSDHGMTFGCTTTKQSVLGMPYVCTGPATSQTADWPAYTTSAAPVAGPGVNKSMLGEVARAGIGGEQVTYNGHPLYLFDHVPGAPSGENWDEPSLPADHGTWWLVSPAGLPLGSEGVMSTVTINGQKDLGAELVDGGGVVVVPVYSYSGGASCTGECEVDFPPLYAAGTPGIAPGLTNKAGLVTRADGSMQRSWGGKALYTYSDEGISPSPAGIVFKGNGNGVKVSGGTFSLVAA